MPAKVLIVDDEEKLRTLLARLLKLESYVVFEAKNLKTAYKFINTEEPDVILCDVKLPDGNGIDFITGVKQKNPLIEIIMLTAYGNIPDGIQAIRNGAFDYITKGDDNDKIIPLLSQAINKANQNKKSAIKIKNNIANNFDDIIGNSKQIKDAINLAKKIAATDTTVLLLGETGTGKEIFANTIHANSNRAQNAFVAINCSAFTKDLLEGELFGYKAGAYTGAIKDKKGLIELADKGTLLLDEIGDMNIELQAKLLRVLETGEFIKLGDEKSTKINVRIIAATNKNLFKAVEDGSFREDLFYRLNVFSIHLPCLRERREDIPLLTEFFLSDKNVSINKAALQLLQLHTWKGNIRELKNVLERASILTDNNIILPEHLPFEIQNQNTTVPNNLSLSSVEKNHIQKVLQHTNGNKTKTAELLGIGLTTLYRKIEEYNIH